MVYYITGNPIVIKIALRHDRIFPHREAILVRIRDIDAHLRAIPSKNAWLMKCAFRAARMLNELGNWMDGSGSSAEQFDIVEITSFDERIDIFWEEVSRSHDFIVERKREVLNWRYCDPRAGQYTIREAEGDGRVLGYNVLSIERHRPDYPLGYIADMLVLPGRLDVANALVKDAIGYFDAHKVNAISCLVIKGHPYEGVFKRHGLLDSTRRTCIFYDPLGRDDILNNLSKEPGRVFTSRGDHDVV